MDWEEQEKRALEILKDPGAEERQWLDACDKIGSRRASPHLATSRIIEWPIALMASFCSGIASIAASLMIGSVIVAIILTFSGIWAYSSSGFSAFLCVAGLSVALGFALGICRLTPAKHEGFRAGLVMPMFGATVLANLFCMSTLLSWFGSWAYNMPIVSLFLAIAAYKLGSNVLHQLIREERREQLSCSAGHLDSSTSHKAIALARSNTESESQKKESDSDPLRIEPEKLQLSSEILQIEREKVKIEREKLELEREKFQIELERMRRDTKRPPTSDSD